MRPRTWLVPILAGFALLLAACAPAAPPPTAAPPKPTEAPKPAEKPAAKPTEAPAAKPTAAPAPKPTEAPAAKASPAPRRGGTLRVSTLGGAPKILHPYPEAQQYTSPWVSAATLMWAGLIDIDWDKLDYVADPRFHLARELPKVSNAGRTYTFTLRDDIKWSDGRPITSADFQFAWDNASKKENNWVGLSSVVERIETFRTPDPKTVEVTLKQPLARTLALAIVGGIGPVPRHVWEGKPWLDPQANPEVLKPTVVSGPYLPKELTAERHSYTRNPNWWGKQPNLDEIVFVNASPTTVLQLLQTRQVEWAQNFPPAQFADAKKIPTVNVVDWAGAIGTYRVMEFNLKRPILADKKVREALVRAIDRKDLVQFEDDLAEPQFGLYPNTFKWANPNVEKYEFNQNRSRQLLQEAGLRLDGSVLKDASGQPVKLEILWPTTSQPRGKMATYAQQQWKQLGIETTVTGLEFNAYVDRVARQKDFDISMGTYGQTGIDPDDTKSQYTTTGTQNVSGYSNPRVDELYQQGAVEQDEQKRKQIYDEIQRTVVDALPTYPMLTLKNFTAFDKKVEGIKPLKGNDILTRNNLQVLDWWLSQ